MQLAPKPPHYTRQRLVQLYQAQPETRTATVTNHPTELIIQLKQCVRRNPTPGKQAQMPRAVPQRHCRRHPQTPNNTIPRSPSGDTILAALIRFARRLLGSSHDVVNTLLRERTQLPCFVSQFCSLFPC